MRMDIRNNVLRNAKNLHEEGYGRVVLNDSWLATIEKLCVYATELEEKMEIQAEAGLRLAAMYSQRKDQLVAEIERLENINRRRLGIIKSHGRQLTEAGEWEEEQS